jgi:hypothetical protein
MARDNQQEFPPLLQAGFHTKTIDELRQLCVNGFPQSVRRPKIMEGLDEIIWELSELGIVAEVWIDGSFTTKKIEPDDSDLLICIKEDFLNTATREQHVFINDLKNKRKGFKDKFYCDLYVLVEYGHATSKWMRSYWIKQFGFSRSNEMKGIVIITTPTDVL